jgi:hypothetical protein
MKNLTTQIIRLDEFTAKFYLISKKRTIAVPSNRKRRTDTTLIL